MFTKLILFSWFAAVICIAVIIGSVLVLSAGVPRAITDTQFTAVGTILGAGGFLLAITATVIAFAAYFNSLPRPDVQLVSADPVAQSFPPVGTLGLKVTIENKGVVAARFVAVRVTFSNWRWQFEDRNAPTAWVADYSTNPFFEQVTWEGGADAVIHPTWPYHLPLLGPLKSHRSFGAFSVPNEAGVMVPDVTPKSIDFTVEIVADRMTPLPIHQSIPID
jgi:hypothetical protein